MDSFGTFHLEETDGKPYELVYHHPKYHPIPQTQSPTFSGEAVSHDHPLQPLFLCPQARKFKHQISSNSLMLTSSPLDYIMSTTNTYDHHPVLPLFWCNNKEFNNPCGICNSKVGTNYYFCEYHNYIYHKECVESPPKIKHPYHPEHSLQLCFIFFSHSVFCLCCGREADYLVYQCTICQIFMHPVCAMKPIPFFIDQPKRHDHPLTFFTRKPSLTCNVCGLFEKMNPTYICAKCNFVAHNDCMYSPCIIKISRHHHRIFYNSSLCSSEGSCGVCRKPIDSDYGAYTCDKCSSYAVNIGCVLGKDVWDGKELKSVSEEDDILNDDGPFDKISKGLIRHFLHDHHLRLEVNIFYDENKLCQACALPIYEGNFYSCMECDQFILHETCANVPRKIQHALHPHTLTLRGISIDGDGWFRCSACNRECGGFVYECHIRESGFNLDVRCASIAEPFDYKAHEHPLFLSLDPIEEHTCQVCKTICHKQLNCIKCNFIVCIKCTTLPYKAKYKCDTHFLFVLFGEEIFEKDQCEVCERDLGDTNTKVFYRCNECCTSVHIDCLFGEDLYLKPGQLYTIFGEYKVQVLGKSNISRPICDYCKNRIQSKIWKSDYATACSMKCVAELLRKKNMIFLLSE